MVAARMAVVTAFVIVMPCWAVFWAHEQVAGSARQSVAKTALPAAVPAISGTAYDLTTGAGEAAAPPRTPAVTPPTPQPVTAPALQERALVSHLETRLQQLGAVYLRLTYQPHGTVAAVESAQAGHYHFVCRMPVPGTMVYHKMFESTAEDPVWAMRQVLHQVEQWMGAHGRE